jgi:hypothetical protein
VRTEEIEEEGRFGMSPTPLEEIEEIVAVLYMSGGFKKIKLEGYAVIHFAKNGSTLGARQKYSIHNIPRVIISVFWWLKNF